MIVVSGFTFEHGTSSIGGTVSLESYRSNINTKPTTIFRIYPQLGYFFNDRICLELLLAYEAVNYSNYDAKSSNLALGFGSKYYIKNFYGGAGILLQSFSNSYAPSTDNMDVDILKFVLIFEIGYLIPIIEDVYIDIGIDYFRGLGNYKEESEIDLGAGIKIFFGK